MKTRDIIMLCPCCQRTRKATVGIDIKGEPETVSISPSRYMGIDVWANCPDCEVRMYQADEDLVNALKMLNGAGIRTTHHCSMAHSTDGYENGCVRLVENDLYSRTMYEEGPHIGIKGLDHETIENLYEFMKQYTSHYRDDEILRLDCVHEVHTKRTLCDKTSTIVDSITLRVMCAKVDTETLKEACNVLTEFIHKWLLHLNNGTLPTGKGARLKRIAQRSYIYPDQDVLN